MKDSDASPRARPIRQSYAPGSYVSCPSCGRLIKIEWATRSIVCSCGARIQTDRSGKKPAPAETG
jgi:hypothetical protein